MPGCPLRVRPIAATSATKAPSGLRSGRMTARLARAFNRNRSLRMIRSLGKVSPRSRRPFCWRAARRWAAARGRRWSTASAAWTTSRRSATPTGARAKARCKRAAAARILPFWSRSRPTRTSRCGSSSGPATTPTAASSCVARTGTKITDENCYEANIFDQRPDPTYGTGAIVKVAKVSPMPKAGGKWNIYEITARGNRLVLVLNGVKTVDVEDSKLASGPDRAAVGPGNDQVPQGRDPAALIRTRPTCQPSSRNRSTPRRERRSKA